AGGPQEPVVGHPAVVVELGEVAPPGVGEVDDHDGVVREPLGHLQGGGYRGAAGPADEEALLAGDAPGGGEAHRVADRHHLVDHRRVVGAGPEVLAGALHEVRAAGAARVHRALGGGADDLDVGVALLQVAPDAGDRAAGADAAHEVGDPPPGLGPDLGPGGVVLGLRVVRVVVLVRLPGPRDLLHEPVRH